MSFFSRLFGRKPEIEDRRDGVCWARGDLAECIDDRWRSADACDPKLGDIVRVARVDDAFAVNCGYRAIWLVLEGKPFSYESIGFRKLRHAHEAADATFTAFVKRPVRQPEPVNG